MFFYFYCSKGNDKQPNINYSDTETGTFTHKKTNGIAYSIANALISLCIWHYAHADKCIYFKQAHMLTQCHASYHFNSSVQRVIDQWQVSRALCNFGRKKNVVSVMTKYTWTNLKIVRLGIVLTHGWVELAPTVPTSLSHRSSTVYFNQYFSVRHCFEFNKT